MSVLLARSYTSAASSTLLWPSAPLTTTAFTPARRIIRVRVWRLCRMRHRRHMHGKVKRDDGHSPAL
jgi:hypothetical protein